MLIGDGGGADVDQAAIKIDVSPLQGEDLGAPQTGKSQKSGELHIGTGDGGEKERDLVGSQKRAFVRRNLRKRHGRGLNPGLLAEDGLDKPPGIGQRFRGAGERFGVYGEDPITGGNVENGTGGERLEPIPVNDPVAHDCGRGKCIRTLYDKSVDGFGERQSGAGRFDLPLTCQIFSFYQGGAPGTLPAAFFCDADGAAINAELDAPAAGRKADGIGDFHAAPPLFLAIAKYRQDRAKYRTAAQAITTAEETTTAIIK